MPSSAVHTRFMKHSQKYWCDSNLAKALLIMPLQVKVAPDKNVPSRQDALLLASLLKMLCSCAFQRSCTGWLGCC
jgi:hypothetical protein